MTRNFRLLLSKVGIWILFIFFCSSTVWGQGIRPRERVPPTAPTNLVVTALTPHSVSLAWGPSTDNSGSFNYVICCAKATVTVAQTVTSRTLEGLDSGATYVLRVYAKDAAGNISSPSNSVTVTLPGDAAAPTEPVVTVHEVGPTHISLSWTSTDSGPIWYWIYLDGQSILTTNSKSGTIAPLEQETTYTITVRAKDAEGNWSPVSDAVIVTTLPSNPDDHTPPTTPTNVSATGSGDITVSWNPSTDDFAPQSLIRYDVYVNGVLSAVVVGKTNAGVHIDTGVNTISVIAVDTADNESAPGTVTVII
jgi:chitinase